MESGLTEVKLGIHRLCNVTELVPLAVLRAQLEQHATPGAYPAEAVLRRPRATYTSWFLGRLTHNTTS